MCCYLWQATAGSKAVRKFSNLCKRKGELLLIIFNKALLYRTFLLSALERSSGNDLQLATIEWIFAPRRCHCFTVCIVVVLMRTYVRIRTCKRQSCKKLLTKIQCRPTTPWCTPSNCSSTCTRCSTAHMRNQARSWRKNLLTHFRAEVCTCAVYFLSIRGKHLSFLCCGSLKKAQC